MSPSKTPRGLWAPLTPKDRYRIDSLGAPNTVLDPYPVDELDYQQAYRAIKLDQIGADPTCDVDLLKEAGMQMTESLGNGNPADAIKMFHTWGRVFYAHKQEVNARRALQLAYITALRWSDHQVSLESGTLKTARREA